MFGWLVLLWLGMMISWIVFRGTKQQRLLLCSMDSDIKIAPDYSSKNKRTIPETPDQSPQELKEQKQNGNLDKARALGVSLANELLSEESVADFGVDAIAESEEIRRHRKILFAFVVVNCVERIIKSSLVSQAIQNAFFDEVKRHSQDIYELITDDAAYSLYYLCVRTSTTPAQCIGQTFAKLVEHPQETFCEFGKALYMRFEDCIQQKIQQTCFA